MADLEHIRTTAEACTEDQSGPIPKRRRRTLDLREAKANFGFMTPAQRHIFEVFVHLGPERTLPKLFEVLEGMGIKTPPGTIRRWAHDFKWFAMAEQTDVEIAQEVGREMLPEHVNSTKRALDAINKLKEKFYERVEKNEITVDLADFVTLIKTEAFIKGDPTERTEHTETKRLQIDLTDDQLLAAIRIAAAQQHGLPPPKNVTPEPEPEPTA